MRSVSAKWVGAADLPAQSIGILQGILAACLQGLEGDLQEPERLQDPSKSQAELAALQRVQVSLERGEVAGPDEEACRAIEQLAVASDGANNHATVVAEHDALWGLLARLKGPEG